MPRPASALAARRRPAPPLDETTAALKDAAPVPRLGEPEVSLRAELAE